MSYEVTPLCQSCGRAIDLPAGSWPLCRECHTRTISFGLTDAAPEPESDPNRPPWSLSAAIVVWGLFTLSIVIVPTIALFIWAQVTGVPPHRFVEEIQKNPEAGLVGIAATLGAHILMTMVAWGLVTSGWTRRFSPTVGWSWHPRFKLRHASATVVLLYGLTFLLSYVLPTAKTQFDELLEISHAIRLVVAGLAVVTAPFIEELIYRGILYPAIHAKLGPIAAVGVVSGLFALVHVPQYSSSMLILVALLLLSFVLTAVRAVTGRLLPCYVIHLLYNGVGATLILTGYATIFPRS
jgi:hypothetical protein